MTYTPGAVPQRIDPVLGEFLARELRRIGIEITSLDGQDTVTYTSAPLTLSAANDFVAVSATASTNITLPPLAGNFGRKFTVKKIDATASIVVIDGSDSETIDGAATRTLSAQYAFYAVIAGISDWHIIGR